MTAIGDVPLVPLEVHQGSDVRFAVEWWADQAGTVPVAVSDAVGGVTASDQDTEPLLLDLGLYITIGGAGNNIVTVDVPGADTELLDPLLKGVWDFTLVSVAGEQRKVARGPARIHRSTVTP